MPLNQEPLFHGSSALLHHFPAWLRVIGRLRPGASPAALPARLTNELRLWLVNDSGMQADWMAGIRTTLPKQMIKVVPPGTGVGVLRDNYGASLRILLSVCSLVLLIACANIANLLLARGAARRANTSVRLALGAWRGRLIRQSLTESLVLSVFGGTVGLAVAYLAPFAGHGVFHPFSASSPTPCSVLSPLLHLQWPVRLRERGRVPPSPFVGPLAP